MAGNPQIKAIGPSYTLADRKAACQRAVNLRMVQVEGLGEDKPVFLQTVDGWENFTAHVQDVRGVYSTGTRLFVAKDDDLLELDDNGVTLNTWTLSTSEGYVSMKHNATQLAVVDGSRLYILTLATNAFNTVPGFAGSDDVDYIDGYFTFVPPGGEQFNISAIDDGSSFDALDFSSADRQPDKIVTHRVFKGEIYLFGERSIEPWLNSGGADFPFIRYNATPIEVGISGKRAVAVTLDSLVWVGHDGYVYAMNGYQPRRISTQAVEEKLADADLSTAVLWTYRSPGCELVGIEATGLDSTWVFDLATRQWHEQTYLNSTTETRLNLKDVVFHNDNHYAAWSTVLLRRNQSTRTFAGYSMVKSRTWPHLMRPSLEPISFRSLELACSTGEGGNCFLQISNDGGFTWGPLLIKSLGVTGRWMQRVRWHFLGSARDRVFKVGCSDDVSFNIHMATVDA
jgi:hypothetical protein